MGTKIRFIKLSFLIMTLVLSGCSPNASSVSSPSPGQQAVSVSQRQGSLLTPTTPEGVKNIEITQETQLQDGSGLSTETRSPDQNPSAQVDISSTQAEILQLSNTLAPSEGVIAVTPPPEDTISPTAMPTRSASEQSESPIPVVCDPAASSDYEAEVIALINEERKKMGMSSLSIQSQLTTAARNHTDELTCGGFFSHNSPSSGSPIDRIIAVGYSFTWIGENIAAGYTSPTEVVAGWMNSEGHRANILNENFIHIGIGYANWGESEYGAYWTAVFASP